MFNSLFLAPAWLWIGLFAAAVLLPILIHLIQLWRYQKVHWPAMEFLLRSIRRKQRTVWLRQLLLILNRIALLLLAILLFARISCRDSDRPVTSQGQVHLVIVDDSCSMGQVQTIVEPVPQADEPLSQTCFDNARQAVARLASQLSEIPGSKLVLVRTSSSSEECDDLQMVDCDSQINTYINNFFAQGSFDHATSPFSWINRNLARLPDATHGYLVTDCRQPDMATDEAEMAIRLAGEKYTDFKLVTTADVSRSPSNLALTALRPEHDLMAVGVPTYLTIQVTNFGSELRRNIPIKLRKATHPADARQLAPVEEASLLIPELLPGQSFDVQVPVLVNTAGPVFFEAELPRDDLQPDNRIHQVVPVRAANRVLLVTDSRTAGVRYLQWLFEPRYQGSLAVNSGFQAEIQTPSDVANDRVQLSDYQVVCWLSDDLSNLVAIEKVESHVRDGGLLLFVPGPFADPSRINQRLFRDGAGWLTFPLDSSIDLPARRQPTEPDIEFQMPRFQKLFAGDSRRLLADVRIFQKFIPPRDWVAAQTADTEVLATVRGRQTTPLIIRSRFGSGTVISSLVPFEDSWTNWATNPTFLVLIYELIHDSRPFESQSELRPGVLIPDVASEPTPATSPASTVTLQRSDSLENWPAARPVQVARPATHLLKRRGLYRLMQDSQPRLFVVNVNSSESELRVAEFSSPVKRLSLPADQIVEWTALGESREVEAGNPQQVWWLILVAFFATEQWLAYLQGFHRPPAKPDGERTGPGFPGRRHG